MYIIVRINDKLQIRQPERDNLIKDKYGNYWSQNNEVVYNCHSVVEECNSLQEALDKALFLKYTEGGVFREYKGEDNEEK